MCIHIYNVLYVSDTNNTLYMNDTNNTLYTHNMVFILWCLCYVAYFAMFIL